ncbi:hypothetical protein AWZ03_013136 [Drosophila navojoa]|uniref:Uncharacterized protein n=1 Tax=Drosophila navojoa TaxID=7232 RepID=A0A484AXW4_DRONA|nr:hypothetical protein AWZ03_013136 [Drosophila navojoa]
MRRGNPTSEQRQEKLFQHASWRLATTASLKARPLVARLASLPDATLRRRLSDSSPGSIQHSIRLPELSANSVVEARGG